MNVPDLRNLIVAHFRLKTLCNWRRLPFEWETIMSAIVRPETAAKHFPSEQLRPRSFDCCWMLALTDEFQDNV